MLISRAGGTPVKTVAHLDSSGASQVIISAPCTMNVMGLAVQQQPHFSISDSSSHTIMHPPVLAQHGRSKTGREV